MTTTAEPTAAEAPEPTSLLPQPIVSQPWPEHEVAKGSMFLNVLRTTDHKLIGRLYLVTSFLFFFLGGAMALLMRAELARPGMQFLSPEQYNQLFTMHGTIMLLFFATPLVFAFANLVLPLQIGSPDVAFPRLNAFSYWLFLFGALTATSGFVTPGGAADGGWTFYMPLNDGLNAPGVGQDLWIIGVGIAGLGTILGGVNMITTVITLRCPGMTMFRMPIFTWNILVTSLLVLFAFPILTAALLVAYLDRHLDAQVYAPDNGGAILWQHLFWFFGHPEVYIVALPFFGIITEVIPVFSRKPLFGYKSMVFATLAIAALSLTVWAHHMFTTGKVLLPFFSIMTFLIAVPTGIKFFNWTGTMWRGSITFETPMLFAIGFLVTFLFGGLTGVILASPPLDFHVSDTYFVVAHFHYVLVRHHRLRGICRRVLLVPEIHRPLPGRADGQAALLAHVHRLPHDVPGAALAGCRRHAAPLRRLPAHRRLHRLEHVVDDRLVRAGRVPDPVRLQHLQVLPLRRGGHRRRPVGPRQLAGMGDLLPATATQLHVHPRHPFRAAGIRAPLPAPARPARSRGARWPAARGSHD